MRTTVQITMEGIVPGCILVLVTLYYILSSDHIAQTNSINSSNSMPSVPMIHSLWIVLDLVSVSPVGLGPQDSSPDEVDRDQLFSGLWLITAF